jgi:hypothetical protein
MPVRDNVVNDGIGALLFIVVIVMFSVLVWVTH